MDANNSPVNKGDEQYKKCETKNSYIDPKDHIIKAKKVDPFIMAWEKSMKQPFLNKPVPSRFRKLLAKKRTSNI